MGIFSRKKDKGKLVLVFYIGSSSVGGALFWAEQSGIPKIVYSISEPITLEENINASRFLSLTLKSLNIVASEIYKSGMGAPEMVFCVLSSPWYVSETRIIKFEKNTPFAFTSKLALELVQKEISLFEDEHMAKHKDSGDPMRTIELKNIKTTLNGYETSSPLNQKGKDLEMTIFVSIGGDKILKKIEGVIRGHFHVKEVTFSSFALSSFAVVRDMYVHQSDFLLMNISGELTDISMVKKNILRESISFPLGVNFITRGVASFTRSSLDEARSSVSLLKNEHASEATVKALGPVVDKLKKEWLAKFQVSLSNLSNDISVPSTIYLSVEKDMSDFFGETIKAEQFNQYTLTESKFKIIFLGAEVFHGLAQFEENAVHDPFLILDSIYVNRFLINSGSPRLG